MSHVIEEALIKGEVIRGKPFKVAFLKRCSRCGGNHRNLKLKPFKRSEEWSHWAKCPKTGDPILLVCSPDKDDVVTTINLSKLRSLKGK